MSDGDGGVIKATIEALIRPVSDVVDKIAGPAAEELGLTIQDHIRVIRFRRQVRLFERVKAICLEAGIAPRRVPLKLLAPIIEAASVEEDDNLQDIWARLLASAADPATRNTDAMPSYFSVLREKFRRRKVFECLVRSAYTIPPERLHTITGHNYESPIHYCRAIVDLPQCRSGYQSRSGRLSYRYNNRELGRHVGRARPPFTRRKIHRRRVDHSHGANSNIGWRRPYHIQPY